MKTQCDICNRKIEKHLQKQNKGLCFACLSEELSSAGVMPTFNIKQQPVHGECAICELETTGHNLSPSPWGFICTDCRDLCETQTGVSWDHFKISSQQEWLVKANRRILGPFSSEEVTQKLKENLFVPVDEIMAPLGRWHLIRDEEQFRSVINEIKNRASTKGERISESTASGSFSNSGTSSLDPQERPFLNVDKLLQGTQAIEDAQVKEETPLRTSASPKSRDLLKSYAFSQDARVVRDIRRVQDSKIGLALVVLVLAGVIAALKLGRSENSFSLSKAQSFQEAMSAGLRAEKVGDYQRALTYFSEARNSRPNDSELLLHLAPLTFYYDRQVLLAQRMFKQIVDTEQGVNYKKAGYLGLGLIALDSHELDSARDYFIKVLGLDATCPQAMANLGVVSFYKDNLSEAEAYLVRALDKDETDGAIIISMADVIVAGSDSQERKKKLKDIQGTIEKFLMTTRDYRQEILVEYARVLTLLDRDHEAARRLDEFLDVDPEQTDLFLRDLQLYRGRASWDQLLETLKKTASRLPSTPRLTAALGLSMYRGREKLDGAQSIEQALSQSPKDPLLMALAGWVELKLGRRENGVANIKEAALTSTKFKLPFILHARLCMEDKDFDCAKRDWEKVMAIDGRAVEAYHGLAAVAWMRKDPDTATRWLRQGQALDAFYTPFLSLNQELQAATQGGHE